MNHNQSLRMTTTTFKYILEYYKDLYRNYEIQTIPEVANNLGLSYATLKNFWKNAYSGPNNGKFNAVDKMILLCTKFINNCQYKEDQKLLKKEIIQRQLKKCILEHSNQTEENKKTNKSMRK